MQNSFSQMHPIVNFSFFAFVITLSMFLMDPVCLLLSFICSLINALYLNGQRAVKLSLVYVLPMILLIAAVNPIFNHEGATILTYLSSGNPVTLESIIYGIASAIMMAAVILWFSSFNTIMTSDKFVYLFGRIIPSLSLVLSMALRFIPKFSSQFKNVRDAQKCIGRDISDGNLPLRIKNAVKIISIMLTWSMENAVETADSMKSRGHGLKKRTAFSIYSFKSRDAFFLAAVFILGFTVIISAISGCLKYSYFPAINGGTINVYSILSYISYAVLMLLPMVINVKEDINWKRLQSRI